MYKFIRHVQPIRFESSTSLWYFKHIDNMNLMWARCYVQWNGNEATEEEEEEAQDNVSTMSSFMTWRTTRETGHEHGQTRAAATIRMQGEDPVEKYVFCLFLHVCVLMSLLWLQGTANIWIILKAKHLHLFFWLDAFIQITYKWDRIQCAGKTCMN